MIPEKAVSHSSFSVQYELNHNKAVFLQLSIVVVDNSWSAFIFRQTTKQKYYFLCCPPKTWAT